MRITFLLLLFISSTLTTLWAQGPCGTGPCEVCGVSATISSISGGEINQGISTIPGQVQAGGTASGSQALEITATSCGEINFTIDLNFDWDHGNNNNWIHGISFNSSPNWSAANGILPGPGWLFFQSITGVCSNVTYGAGYYYDPPGTDPNDNGNGSSFNGVFCSTGANSEDQDAFLQDGNPADNYGDDCQDNCPTFGFNLSYCPITGGQTVETISFYLTEDGESGGWVDSDQCVFLLAFDVIINAAGVQIPETYGPICPGECITLDAGQGCDLYEWSTNEFSSAIEVCPTVTSTYTVTVTGSTGCIIKGEVEVLVPGPCCEPEAGTILANPTVTCPGQFINFQATNFHTDPDYAHMMLVCDSNGDILQINNGSFGSWSSAICSEFTVYSYNYLIGNTGTAPTPSIGDNISSLDCMMHCCDLESLPITFEEVTPSFVSLPPNILVSCGDPFPSPVALSYSNGIAGACAIMGSVLPTVSTSGNMTFYNWSLVTDCGVTITHEQIITTDNNLDMQLNPTAAYLCPLENFDLASIQTTSDSGNPISISYHSDSPATAGNQLLNTMVNPILTTTYYVFGQDQFGCVIEIPFTITPSSDPINTITPTPTTTLDCNATSINLIAANENNVNYTWNINGQIVTGAQVALDQAANVSMTALNTINGCESSNSIVIDDITEYPMIMIAPTAPITCYNSTSLIDATASQMGGNISYAWLDGTATPIPGANSATLSVNNGGVYYLQLTDSNNGCVNVDTVVVESNVNFPLSEPLQNVELFCAQTSTLLNLNTTANPSSLDIQWTSANGTIVSGAQSTNPEVEGEGMYYVSMQDIENGCITMDSLLLTIDMDVPESALLSIEDETCINDNDGTFFAEQITGGQAPYEYTLNGISTATDGQFTMLSPGEYFVNITDDNGCSLDTTFVVEPGVHLTLDLPSSLSILSTESGLLQGISNYSENELSSISWSPAELVTCPDCLTTNTVGFLDQKYTLTITHPSGCETEESIQLFVRPDIQVYIPNVFSPNSDGANDYFTLFSNIEIAIIKEMLIFDRWGELVFQKKNFPSNDPSKGWDGTLNGKPMKQSVFTYLFVVELRNKAQEEFSGDISLIR